MAEQKVINCAALHVPPESSVPPSGREVRWTFPVEGMTCASCVARVEKALASVPGVLSASVNLATQSGTVSFLPGVADMGAVRAAVESAGYAVPEVRAEEDPVARATAKHGTTDMNTLVALGTTVAYAYSLVATFFPGLFAVPGAAPHVYFDTSAAIISLILLGRYFETRAKGKTSEAVKRLIGLQPKTARGSRDGGGGGIPPGAGGGGRAGRGGKSGARPGGEAGGGGGRGRGGGHPSRGGLGRGTGRCPARG